MRNPVLVASLAVALVGAALAVSPLRSAEDPEPAAPSTAETAFPEGWAGTWRGELRILLAGGKGQKLPMTLTIGPKEDDGARRWAIRYGDQPAREYRLVTVDAESGRFQIDERNGIVLPACLIGDELVSSFAVSGNRLTASYRLVGDGLDFCILVTSASPTATTGGEGQIPEVESFDARSVHRARLQKQA